jgi:hypothetical protein
MSTKDVVTVACVGAVILAILVWGLVWMLRRPRPQGASAPVAYGVDFSWSRPSAESLRAAGYSFVCRYLSWSTTGKNLTREEADYWKANGFGIVSNWEYYADAAKGGYGQGVSDATEALRQHYACGAAEYDPVIYSVDYDVPTNYSTTRQRPDWRTRVWRILVRLVHTAQRQLITLFGGTPSAYTIIADYVRGITSVHGDKSTVGIYAEYDIIRRLFNDGLITYGWQTYAWSYGYWDPRAQLRQVHNGLTVDGQEVDRNEAWQDNYGQWGAGKPPHWREAGGVLLNCPWDKERTDLIYVGPFNEVWHSWWSGGMHAAWDGRGSHENLGGRIAVGTLAAQWTPDGGAIYIVGLGEGSAELPEGAAGQYWGFTLDRYGNRSGWGSLEGIFGVPAG